jgi:hypothetical protein
MWPARLAILLFASSGFASPVAVPELRALPRIHVPQAAVASNGHTALSAWIDDRAPAPTLRATRIGSGGAALERQGIRVAHSAKPFGTVATVWNGSEFVVFAPDDDAIAIARVAADGTVLESANPIPEAGAFLAEGAVWNGSHYMLSVRTLAGNQQVIVKLLVLDAALRVTREIVLDPNPSVFVGGCGVATDGTGFAVVWERREATQTTMFVDRYDGDGAPLSRADVPAGSGTALTNLAMRWPSISWNDATFTIVWTSGGVFGLALSPQGTLGEPFRISDQNGLFASIGWNGAQHLVTWTVVSGDSRLAAARITPSGSVLETRVLGATTAGQAPAAITSADGNFAVVWFTSIFTLDGAPHPLTSDYAPQLDPKIAGDAAGMFAAWNEAGVIYGSRLAADGTPLDGSGIALSAPERAVATSWLHVITNGKVFLVVWSDPAAGSVLCARVTSDGVVLDPGGVALASSIASFAVAGDGTDFMVALADGLNVAAVRIPSAGPIRVLPRPILPTMNPQVPLAIAWTGRSYSLLWSEITEMHCTFSCTTASTRRMTTLSSDGAVLATREVALPGFAVGLERLGDELLYVSSDGGFYTQRLAIDGTPAAPRMRAGDTVSTLPAILVRTSAGFAIVHQGPDSADRVAVIHLDAQGTWVMTRVTILPTVFTLSDALGTDDGVVIAYIAPSDIGDALRRAFTMRIRSSARRWAAHH